MAHVEMAALAAARDLRLVAALAADADLVGRVAAIHAAGETLHRRNAAALAIGRDALRIAALAVAADIALRAAIPLFAARLGCAADRARVVVDRAVVPRIAAAQTPFGAIALGRAAAMLLADAIAAGLRGVADRLANRPLAAVWSDVQPAAFARLAGDESASSVAALLPEAARLAAGAAVVTVVVVVDAFAAAAALGHVAGIAAAPAVVVIAGVERRVDA